ncbi:unnamed protein product [Rhizoctonia solani]|uniref:Uncharacterized protein n=1 Tax=Rhizoctonia solani TaxID=456999 RepID=A0A8H2WF47_9AGAM|nr:unnamed protein product [Rhizoctonia solani]
MSSVDNYDPHDPDFPRSRGRADPGVQTRHIIYPPNTRVRVQTNNGPQYEATVVQAEPDGYIIRDDGGNERYVRYSDILYAIP